MVSRTAVAALSCMVVAAAGCNGYWTRVDASTQTRSGPTTRTIDFDARLSRWANGAMVDVDRDSVRCREATQLVHQTTVTERWKPSGSPGMWALLGLITVGAGLFPLLSDDTALGVVLVAAGGAEVAYGSGNLLMGMRRRTRHSERPESRESTGCPATLNDRSLYVLETPWGDSIRGTQAFVGGQDLPGIMFVSALRRMPRGWTSTPGARPFVLTHPAGLRKELVLMR